MIATAFRQLLYRRRRVVALGLAVAMAAAVALANPQIGHVAPIAPTGLTTFAQSGKVELAWRPTQAGARYDVLRGTSAGSITQLIASSVATAGYSDTTASNGTTYYYMVRETGTGNPTSLTASATPRAASCSTGNAIAVENCFPGTTNWKATNTGPAPAGIEGYATETSVNAGGSLDLKIDAADNAPYRIEIYRTGYYGGTQGRLVGTIPGLRGVRQDDCIRPNDDTGLIDCGNWSVSASITTSSAWPSGVYLARLVREDNNSDSHILFVVRRNSGTADVLYRVPDTTYQAYNNYGGRSLYDWNSSGDTTVAGTARAVKVSFNRPYKQVNSTQRDWYTQSDVQAVSWLEQQGYDIDYASTLDLETGATPLTAHKVAISGAHDEYWSNATRSASDQARAAGTSLVFLGANGAYWKIRFESSPVTNVARRTMVDYKTTQSGAEDPVERTRTWRDPAGPNQPENALMGQMYIGDNDSVFFPLRVSAAEGDNRIWRHTGLQNLAAGTTEAIGQYLVGWEWDARVANGREPSGVQVVASSPVTGQILTDAGRVYQPGANAVSTSTVYTAASGAKVWSTGTNHWARGLARNMPGVGEPNQIIQQATLNMLSDMGAQPTTPGPGMVVDTPGPPTVSDRSPASGATGVATSASITAQFDRALDPSTVNGTTMSLLGPGDSPVAGTVTYDEATRTARLNPTQALDSATTYSVRLTTGIKSWTGDALASPVTWTFTTQGGLPPAVSTRSPAAGATGVGVGANVTATFDRRLDPTSVNGTTFTLRTAGGTAVAGDVSYDDATRTVRLDPTNDLAAETDYTATLTTGIRASDGTPMASAVTWSFRTQGALAVTGRTPAPLATGVAPSANVRAVFSRAVDPATLTSQSFTLTGPGGAAVPAAVSYDPATTTAVLTPNAPLALMTTYTATVTTAVRAADGGTMAGAVTWTFTTATTAPPAPVATQLRPAAGATAVPLDSTVSATFDRSLDPATVNGQSVRLRDSSGTILAANVAYDDASRTVTLTPTASLEPGAQYTATLTTAIRSSAGAPLAADVSWSFTAADCPCSLMPSSMTPQQTSLPVRDGRPAPGPWTYELGTKIVVDQAMRLTSIRFYKSPGETGTHVGRVWSSSGTQLASVTFTDETASGWQKKALATPVSLTAGQTYVVSVGFNANYVVTQYGLQTALNSGPLHSVADGANGVFASSAGTFPTSSYRSSNYFVDAVVQRPNASAPAPQVTSVTPVDGATGVSSAATVKATFDSALDPSTVTASSFTLSGPGGTAVPASVAYDAATRTATLTPSSALARSTAYTARLSTAIKSDEGTPLAAAVSWGFSTASAPVPTVTSTSPTDGATQIGSAAVVRATFDMGLDASTVDGSSFTLTGPGTTPVSGTVSYDGPSRTATFTPAAPLEGGTAYTARLTTAIKSSEGAPLAAAVSFGFTTASCPCSLWPATTTPATTGLDVRDGRSGSGPWSYELGTKIDVTSGARLTAIRYYRDAGETGTHVGRVWSGTGTPLASVTFTGETGSGWQEQALATPLTLSPGQTYVVSVGLNARFVMTSQGLATMRTSGPLRSVADGRNGVYGNAAGIFPTNSWANSSYLVDAVVR